MERGILITGPKGTCYWFPCPDSKDAGRVLADAKATGHHGVLGDPRTRVEYGSTDGREFRPEFVIQGGGDAEVPAASGGVAGSDGGGTPAEG